MAVIHFIDHNRNIVLTQLKDHIPLVDDSIKIKGRIGKVSRVNEINGSYQVHIVFDPVIKPKLLAKDNKKKKR
jgi:hypothetical protein